MSGRRNRRSQSARAEPRSIVCFTRHPPRSSRGCRNNREGIFPSRLVVNRKVHDIFSWWQPTSNLEHEVVSAPISFAANAYKLTIGYLDVLSPGFRGCHSERRPVRALVGEKNVDISATLLGVESICR